MMAETKDKPKVYHGNTFRELLRTYANDRLDRDPTFTPPVPEVKSDKA